MAAPRPKSPLERLLALPLDDRIRAVAKDLTARRKTFRRIDAFDLAAALEVPEPEQPSGDWGFFRVTEEQTVEEYAAEGNSVFDLLPELGRAVSARRMAALEASVEALEDAESPDFAFLKPKERHVLEEAILMRRSEADGWNGLGCRAGYTVQLGDIELAFEAQVEDDGSCFNLQTPYDLQTAAPSPRQRVTDSW